MAFERFTTSFQNTFKRLSLGTPNPPEAQNIKNGLSWPEKALIPPPYDGFTRPYKSLFGKL